MRLLVIAVAVGLGAAACGGAPGPTAEYREVYDRAARLEREGHPAKAAAVYGEAAEAASRPRTRWQAEYRQARELEKSGRRAEALRMYLSIADEDPEGEMAPRCVYYAARIAHEDGDLETALERLRRVLVDYPDNGIAPQAVRRLVQWLEDEGQLDRALASLSELEEELRSTDVGDNLLYHAASIHESRGDWERALETWERQVELHPFATSTLHDDALWRAGNVALEHGEPERALGYLEALVSWREDSWGTGSYYRDRTDDAQLLAGRIRLEHLGEPREAARAFEELSTFPDSILADDGLWWAARAYAAAGEPRRSCETLRRLLERFPYSNHRRQARSAIAAQGC